MFYLNETLNAETAQINGLITKIVADDFEKEVLTCCGRVAEFSSQVCQSPGLIFIVLYTLCLVHESGVEKFRLNFLLDLRLVNGIFAVMHIVATASLKHETVVDSSESTKLVWLAFVKL